MCAHLTLAPALQPAPPPSVGQIAARVDTSGLLEGLSSDEEPASTSAPAPETVQATTATALPPLCLLPAVARLSQVPSDAVRPPLTNPVRTDLLCRGITVLMLTVCVTVGPNVHPHINKAMRTLTRNRPSEPVSAFADHSLGNVMVNKLAVLNIDYTINNDVLCADAIRRP